jgi:hypothetical protein
MGKSKIAKIPEKQYIKLYNRGLNVLDLAELFNLGKRTAEAYEQKLRHQNKIKPRKELISKTVTVNPATAIERPTINWKITKTKISKNKQNKNFKKYLVCADPHIPYVNIPAIKSVLHLMDDVKFDGFILLGDFMDMTPISHWLQDRRQQKSLENKRMIADYEEGNKLLDEFDKRLPKNCDKRFFYGNHERFYYDLIEKYPALEGLFEPKTELKLKEREYIIYDKINHIERIGRLNFLHGLYHSQNYVKAHLDKMTVNVIHADMHSPRCRLAESPAREIALAGYCVGCLCDLNPDYMRNKPSKWSHGFAIVYFYGDSGFFDVDLKRIVKGKFVYDGKLYDGNK